MRMRVAKLEKSLVKTKARKLCQIRTQIQIWIEKILLQNLLISHRI